MNLFRYSAAGLCLLAIAPVAIAKPIAFAHGTTIMAEYGAGTMTEAQVFYAPKYFLVARPGAYSSSTVTCDDERREITYARVNYLVKRWNLEAAQANVFTWGGAVGLYERDQPRSSPGTPARNSTTRRAGSTPR